MTTIGRSPPLMGTYRIRSRSQNEPPLYATGGGIYLEVAPLDESDRKQIWTVYGTAADNFIISNVSTGQILAFTKPGRGDPDYRVIGDKWASLSGRPCTIEPHPKQSGDTFFMAAVGPSNQKDEYGWRVFDVASKTRVILWERNFLDNQLWNFEKYVDPRDVTEGQYRIRSKDSPVYLTLFPKDTWNTIRGVELDTSSEFQIWDLKPGAEGSWAISSTVNSEISLGAAKRLIDTWPRGSTQIDVPSSAPTGGEYWFISPTPSEDWDGSYMLQIFRSENVGIWGGNSVLHVSGGYMSFKDPNYDYKESFFFEKV